MVLSNVECSISPADIVRYSITRFKRMDSFQNVDFIISSEKSQIYRKINFFYKCAWNWIFLCSSLLVTMDVVSWYQTLKFNICWKYFVGIQANIISVTSICILAIIFRSIFIPKHTQNKYQCLNFEKMWIKIWEIIQVLSCKSLQMETTI